MSDHTTLDVAPYLGTIEWYDGEIAEFAFTAPHGASESDIWKCARSAAADQFDTVGADVVDVEPLEP